MTVAAIILFLKKYWKKILIGLGILILVITVASTYQNCKPQPKVDLDTVNRINNANEKEVKEELRKKIEENLDVIKSTETNTALTELSVDERNRQIDQQVNEATKKVIEAKNQNGDVTQDQIECILVPEHCK